MSLRSSRGEIEVKYDHLLLSPEEVSLVVEAYTYSMSNKGYPLDDVLGEAEILERTLTFSSIYNYSNSHLKVVV